MGDSRPTTGRQAAPARGHQREGGRRVVQRPDRVGPAPGRRAGIRGVWLRHALETRHKRLMWLEHESRQNTFVLSPEHQVVRDARGAPDRPRRLPRLLQLRPQPPRLRAGRSHRQPRRSPTASAYAASGSCRPRQTRCSSPADNRPSREIGVGEDSTCTHLPPAPDEELIASCSIRPEGSVSGKYSTCTHCQCVPESDHVVSSSPFPSRFPRSTLRSLPPNIRTELSATPGRSFSVLLK